MSKSTTIYSLRDKTRLTGISFTDTASGKTQITNAMFNSATGGSQASNPTVIPLQVEVCVTGAKCYLMVSSTSSAATITTANAGIEIFPGSVTIDIIPGDYVELIADPGYSGQANFYVI